MISMTTGHNLGDQRVLVPVYLLTVEMIMMMILCLITIQYRNDYTSMYYEYILCNLLYFACILICLYR